MSNLNFSSSEQDPWLSEEKPKKYVHIRIQQRNGRKSLTTVQGLPDEVDMKRVLQALKKKFCCNGTIINDPESGSVFQLQGDQRGNVLEFLTTEGIYPKENIKVHGF